MLGIGARLASNLAAGSVLRVDDGLLCLRREVAAPRYRNSASVTIRGVAAVGSGPILVVRRSGSHEELMHATAPRAAYFRYRRIASHISALISALILALGVSGAGLAQEAPDPDKRPSLIVLVDGSGSMWGGLGGEGKSKLSATRMALEAVLPRVAGSHRLGLASFGPGCRSAGVMVAPGSSGVESITTPLVKFNPRGKGPLSAGLKAAADALGQNSDGAIVLFHDGLDNCGEDQCAAATQLHAARPNLRIYTVSLGVSAAEAAAIACVPNTTGGRGYTADDPAGVTKALEEIAKLIDTTSPTPPVPSTPTEVPVAKPSQTGPSRLVASARLAAGGNVVSLPMSWRVVGDDGKTVLHEAVTPSLKVPLPAGHVRVEVTSGRISAHREIDIAKEGDTVLDITLDAGIVRFDTGAERLASDAEEPLIYLEQISDTPAGSTTQDGAPSMSSLPSLSPLWIARGKAIEAMLPPGSYKAVAEYGLARAVARVKVEAGEALNLALPLEAGRLELSTTPQGLDDVIYRIEVDDPDRPGGRRELAQTAYGVPAFVLSTGTYYVTVATGGEDVRRLVTVRSGEVTRENLKLALVSLEVEATVNGAPASREPLSIGIKPLDNAGSGRPAGERLVSLGRPIRLAPGRYRVTVRHGLNDASAARDIKLELGREQRLRIDLKTSEINLDMADAAGIPLGAVCELKSEQGDVIWRTVEIRPSRVVAPGQYMLRCRAGPLVRDVAVTAAAGQVTRVTPFAQ